MPRPAGKKVFSAAFTISILEKKFGFRVVSQKGSHVKLTREAGRKHTTIIPLHKELAPGTLQGVLELAGITLSEFRNATRK